MKCRGAAKICAALLPVIFLQGCSHTRPGESDPGPHETVRISARARGKVSGDVRSAVQKAIEVYYYEHGGHVPDSLVHLDATFLPEYAVTPACEDGSAEAQTLIYYHRSGDETCAVQVRQYARGGGLLSSRDCQFSSGQWSGGGGVHNNTARRYP